MNCLSFSNNKAEILSFSPEDTRLLGEALGESCYPGLTLLLYGGLGMGKTLLTQGLGASLGFKGIKSPTFIILSEHEGKLPLIHADLYRIDSFSDTDSLDMENYIDQGCMLVVEWAERWNTVPSENRWDVHIEPADAGDSLRRITIEAVGKKAEKALEKAILILAAEKTLFFTDKKQ